MLLSHPKLYLHPTPNSSNQKVLFDLFGTQIEVYIKREDLLHPFVSGNKFRKLKYNLHRAKQNHHHTLLTFGGAFSNHIAATAFAAKKFGLDSIGVIRGEELIAKKEANSTLVFAEENGMKLHFISRDAYRQKDSVEFIDGLHHEFGDFYLIPEGGTNALAIKGCQEILSPEDHFFDYICCAVGTGGTISGIINSSKPHQKVLGFPALKGDCLANEITKYTNKNNWKLIQDYHFGGYAKINSELVTFINEFYKQTEILLDPVYTAKMCYGIYKLIQEKYFEKGAKILLIHTGGLQGISGMNEKLKKQKLPLING